MIPADIGPHPDAPDYYLSMGKPPSMTDDECGSLCVRRVGATIDMIQEIPVRIVSDGLPGERVYPAFMSEWFPTLEEKERIIAGYGVRMLIVGDNLPPSNLWVRGTDEV